MRSASGRPPQQRFRGAVVDHHVGLRQEPGASCGDESGVARPGADDEDASGRGVNARTAGPK